MNTCPHSDPSDLSPKSHLSTFGKWIFLLAIPFLIWVLWPYFEVIKKESGETYILNFSTWTLLKFYLCFYGLYVLPGLAVFSFAGRRREYNPFFSPQRFLLAFLFGMVAHIFAAFIQKYLSFSYQPATVLLCLLASYSLLFVFLRPFKELLKEERPPRQFDFLTWGILLLALFLGVEMVLRARASSASLMGDGFPHLINYLGTLEEGPLPDGLPFYSTFILNIHPMGFHALLAGLKTLIPGIDHIDLLRYFSAVMVPCVVFVFFSFFSFLSKNRPLAAFGTLVLLFVSGGGFSLRVPIVYFPWYWSLAWCLTAGLFFLILVDNFQSKGVYFLAGILLGTGILFHPFLAFRVGTILVFFLPIELLRRVWIREPLLPVLRSAGFFALGTLILLGLWLVPLLLKYNWEETYSFEYLTQNFEKVAPKGIHYIRTIRESFYNLKDLFSWSEANSGWFSLIFAPLGLVAVFIKRREAISSLLLAWFLAMACAVTLGFLMNPYRYFEYFFLSLVALSVYGLGWLYSITKNQWKPLLLFPVLMLALYSIRLDFFPKYRLALHYYGRTHWPPNALSSSRNLANKYLESKKNGNLDQDFGWYRGYLWSRQKKVWDIYLQHQNRQ